MTSIRYQRAGRKHLFKDSCVPHLSFRRSHFEYSNSIPPFPRRPYSYESRPSNTFFRSRCYKLAVYWRPPTYINESYMTTDPFWGTSAKIQRGTIVLVWFLRTCEWSSCMVTLFHWYQKPLLVQGKSFYLTAVALISQLCRTTWFGNHWIAPALEVDSPPLPPRHGMWRTFLMSHQVCYFQAGNKIWVLHPNIIDRLLLWTCSRQCIEKKGSEFGIALTALTNQAVRGSGGNHEFTKGNSMISVSQVLLMIW